MRCSCGTVGRHLGTEMLRPTVQTPLLTPLLILIPDACLGLWAYRLQCFIRRAERRRIQRTWAGCGHLEQDPPTTGRVTCDWAANRGG